MSINRDQVAKKANVSSATVSRVFNSPSSVSENLRKAVYDAANELGYKPNKAAAQLRRSGTGIITVVEFDKKNRPYYWGNLPMFDWFYGQAMRGLHKAIENSSYQLNFSKVSNTNDLIQISKNCDGILGYDIDEGLEEKYFSKIKVPYILAHHILPDGKFFHIATDNYAGGILQGNYLKKNNVLNLLYISGYINEVNAHKQRFEGIKNIYPNLELIEIPFTNKLNIDNSIPQIKSLIINKKIDGIAAVNDFVLMHVLMNLNFDIPYIGYDAAPFTSFLNRSVASIDLNIEKIYFTALNKLIDHLNGAKMESLVLKPSLVEPFKN